MGHTELLPAEGPVGYWLRVGSLFEIQRSLVALTDRDKAPVAYADDRESVYEAARFCRRWRRVRDRARGIGRPFTGPAAALLGIFGLVWWGVAEEASKRRRRRHRLPGIIWWPAQILELVLFMLALTVFAVLSSIPHLLSRLAY